MRMHVTGSEDQHFTAEEEGEEGEKEKAPAPALTMVKGSNVSTGKAKKTEEGKVKEKEDEDEDEEGGGASSKREKVDVEEPLSFSAVNSKMSKEYVKEKSVNLLPLLLLVFPNALSSLTLLSSLLNFSSFTHPISSSLQASPARVIFSSP